MANSLTNDLSLSYGDLVNFSTEAHSELEALIGSALPESFVVVGETGDKVTLEKGGPGVFQASSVAPVVDGDGNTLDVYEYVDGASLLATVAVSDDVVVDIPT